MQLLAGSFLLVFHLAAVADPVRVTYSNDFQSVEVGKLPADFLVMAGAFAVQQENANKFLELPGAPLESFGVLFGPTEQAGSGVAARIQGMKRGRLSPSFGVGLNGANGYRLLVSPGKKALELVKNDALLASAAFEWTSSTGDGTATGWAWLRLQLRRAGDHWLVEGKAWMESQREPAAWMISFRSAVAPPPGRASVWGSPYAGTPIRFDDLSVYQLGAD